MNTTIKNIAEQENLPEEPLTPIEVSVIVLNEIEVQLHLAGDELQRMEDEGGQNQTRAQAAQANDYLKASNRIKAIVPLVEDLAPVSETQNLETLKGGDNAQQS